MQPADLPPWSVLFKKLMITEHDKGIPEKIPGEPFLFYLGTESYFFVKSGQ